MTADATPDSGLRCWHCGRPHRLHDRFCGKCRAELHGDPVAVTVTPSPRQEPPADRLVPHPRPARGPRTDATAANTTDTTDTTTRYLCAAAHLDRDFADTAIREYLVEPTRAVPPTPGLDAVAVLREAVAARSRCKIRDAATAGAADRLRLDEPDADGALTAVAVGLLVVSGGAARAGVAATATTGRSSSSSPCPSSSRC